MSEGEQMGPTTREQGVRKPKSTKASDVLGWMDSEGPVTVAPGRPKGFPIVDDEGECYITVEQRLAAAKAELADACDAAQVYLRQAADAKLLLRHERQAHAETKAALTRAEATLAEIAEDGTEEHNAAVALRVKLAQERQAHAETKRLLADLRRTAKGGRVR